MRRVARWAVAGGLAATVALSATAASAATNPYTPQRLCGSGYAVIDQGSSSSYVTVYLLYNSGNGYNCVVALKGTATAGVYHPMDAYLEVKNGSYGHSAGSKNYYAGPVRRYARARCVLWGGYVSVSGRWYGHERRAWEHCG
jgi:hypothetical protein